MTDATSINAIGMAVTEAQSVLELIAHRLKVDEAIPADEVFTLHVAVQTAIGRLDVIHDVLQVMEAIPATALATAPEVMQ